MHETVEFVDFKELNSNTKRLHLDTKGRWFLGPINLTLEKVFGEVSGPDENGNYKINLIKKINSTKSNF